jgi:hypothetical protein
VFLLRQSLNDITIECRHDEYERDAQGITATAFWS